MKTRRQRKLCLPDMNFEGESCRLNSPRRYAISPSIKFIRFYCKFPSSVHISSSKVPIGIVYTVYCKAARLPAAPRRAHAPARVQPNRMRTIACVAPAAAAASECGDDDHDHDQGTAHAAQQPRRQVNAAALRAVLDGSAESVTLDSVSPTALRISAHKTALPTHQPTTAASLLTIAPKVRAHRSAGPLRKRAIRVCI